MIFRLKFLKQSLAALCSLVIILPSVAAPLRFEFAQRLERSKTFARSSAVTVLPNKAVMIAAYPNDFILTNDLTVIATYPSGTIFGFGKPFGVDDFRGGFYIWGDTNHIIYRKFADGSKDESFVSPSLPKKGRLGDFVVQRDSKILVSYSIDPFSGSSDFPGSNTGLFRLNTDGSVDHSFQLDFVMSMQTEGFVAGGLFVLADDRIQFGVSRFLENGQRDPTWSVASVNGPINCVKLQIDGKSVICGQFNRVNGIPRVALARLNVDGTLDFSFQLSTNGPGFGWPTTAVIQGDGRVVVYFAGLAVVRYLPNGQLDPTLQIRRFANFMGFAMDQTDRIYTLENDIVNQYSGRDRLIANSEPVPFVLQRAAAVDGSWTPITNIPANTPVDYPIPDFPGIGSAFYRMIPGQ